MQSLKISVSVVAVRASRLIHGVHNIKGRVVYFFEMMRQPLHQLAEVAQIRIISATRMGLTYDVPPKLGR